MSARALALVITYGILAYQASNVVMDWAYRYFGFPGALPTT